MRSRLLRAPRHRAGIYSISIKPSTKQEPKPIMKQPHKTSLKSMDSTTPYQINSGKMTEEQYNQESKQARKNLKLLSEMTSEQFKKIVTSK